MGDLSRAMGIALCDTEYIGERRFFRLSARALSVYYTFTNTENTTRETIRKLGNQNWSKRSFAPGFH
jgi:hypothetical protein